jgi:hypothetical protein
VAARVAVTAALRAPDRRGRRVRRLHDVPNDPALRGVTFFMQATDLAVLSDVELFQAW